MLLRKTRFLWILLLFGAFIVTGNDRAEAETALASWYGPGFHGQTTASGEVYDAYGYSAAHKTLPLGTEITVSYAGRSVDLVVNDRGPYSGGRDLDISQGAAEYLGLTGAGVDYVDYEVSGSGGYASGGYASGDRYAAEKGYASGGYAEEGYPERGSAVADAADYDAPGGTYEVQSGDTLTGIAAELGTSVDDLMAKNGLTNPDVLYAGQALDY